MSKKEKYDSTCDEFVLLCSTFNNFFTLRYISKRAQLKLGCTTLEIQRKQGIYGEFLVEGKDLIKKVGNEQNMRTYTRTVEQSQSPITEAFALPKSVYSCSLEFKQSRAYNTTCWLKAKDLIKKVTRYEQHYTRTVDIPNGVIPSRRNHRCWT